MKRVLFLTAVLLFFVVALLPQAVCAELDHSDFDQIRQCIGCHPKAFPTHKRRIPEAMRADLPLDERGRMLCTTCHECITGTCELRGGKPELCAVCHDCREGMACIINSAHIGSIEENGALSSEQCMGCHEGAGGPGICSIGEKTVDVLFYNSWEGSLRKRPDRRILLVDGKVACISCHDPYGTHRAKLVRQNRDSALCMTCHSRLKEMDHSGLEGIESCIACHPKLDPSHKTEVPMKAKAGLPLGEGGRMLCTTCHQCITGTCVLRKSTPELCNVCHDCAEGMACVLGIAHMGDAEVFGESGQAVCYSCHDSNSAPQQCSTEYLKASYGEDVTCVTCHNPYSRGYKKVASRLKGPETPVDTKVCPRYFSSLGPTINPGHCEKCHER